jgi:hypothetical protein
MKYQRIREAIRELLQEDTNQLTVPEQHLAMSGEMVPFGSEECTVDLDYRIEDAKHHRDCCPGRTDAREHYNGLLKILRRQLRASRKLQDNL